MFYVVKKKFKQFKQKYGSLEYEVKHYGVLLINLLVYSTYTENLVCVILVMFLFSYSLYWISPRPNTADLALIRLTSYLYGLTCYLYGNPYTRLVKIHVQGYAPR